MIKYTFKTDEPLTIKAADKANAQRIGEALAVVTEKNKGHLTPIAVVEAARDRKSVLHRHFEWDDKIAAEKHRAAQARDLIRSIHVENADSEDGLSRAYLSIREKDGTSYRTIGDVLGSADLQSRVLAQAERDLISFENRFSQLQDICALVRAVRERIAARRVVAGQDTRASA